GLLRGSFVPPPEIARLRDLTRYRTKLLQDRAREPQRVPKLLEDAGIKLDSVVSDVLGKAARRMLDALMAGESDAAVMAEMALTRMRPKIGELRLALEGRFDEHHTLMLRMHLDHIDHLRGMIDAIDKEVDERVDPFAEHARRLQTIPGIGKRTAEVVISEIGVDMTRFPTSAHLASWAGLCPGNHESAGKRRTGKARKGNAVLRTALCEAAWSAARTKNTYVSAQFRRFARRFGKHGEGMRAMVSPCNDGSVAFAYVDQASRHANHHRIGWSARAESLRLYRCPRPPGTERAGLRPAESPAGAPSVLPAPSALDEGVLERVRGGCGAGCHSDLREDVGEVPGHRLRAEEQGCGDVLVGEAGGDELEDFDFAVGEPSGK